MHVLFLNMYEAYIRPWVEFPESTLFGFLLLIFLAFWAALIAIGYLVGREFENGSVSNWIPILISGGLTLLIMALLLRRGMDYMNQTSTIELCSEYCSRNGFSGSVASPSGAPEQTCRCFNLSGDESLTVPLADLK